MEELLEVEAPAAAGSGLAVARDRRGLYIAKAPRALRLRAGDRLVGARIFFEGAPPEVVARLLEGASGCRVSLCIRRRAPSTGPGPAGHGSAGPGLPTPVPTPPKKPPAAPAVELALPKLPKLGKSRSAPEAVPTVPPAPVPTRPRAAPPRLTVKEAADGRAMQEPSVKAEPHGSARFPTVEVAVPKVTVGLSIPAPAPEPGLRLPRVEVAVPVLSVPETQSKAGDGDAFGGIRVPSVSIAAPSAAVELLPKAEPKAPGPRSGSPVPRSGSPVPRSGSPVSVTPTRLGLLESVPSLGIAVPRVEVALALPMGSEGLRMLGPEPEPPAPGATGTVKPRAPRFALPRVGLALGKLGTGGTGAPVGTGAKLKVPKLSLAPFGATAPVPPGLGRRRSPSLPKLPMGPEHGMKLRRFGGSSPDLRSGGEAKAGSPGAMRALWAQGTLFPILNVGLAAPEDAKGVPKGIGGSALKVPGLELAPPGMDALPEPGAGRWAGLKLRRFGSGAGGSQERGNGDGKARPRRWVPRVGFSPPSPPASSSSQSKRGGGGRLRIPNVELCPQLHGGTPNAALLSP